MLITSSWKIDLLLCFVGVIFILYKYLTRNFDYWKNRGVHYEKPLVFLGNSYDLFFFRKTVGDWMRDLYNRTDDPYMGIFVVDEPSLIIRSPELIKRIVIKDFNYFMDRTIATPKHNELIASMMFIQKGSEWKTVRSKMTPVFTSGKLKGMFPILQTVGDDLVRYVDKKLGELEAKEISCKFAIDAISKCALGINSHCFDDENASFRKLGKAMFDFSVKNAISQTSYFFRQSWVNRLKLDFFEMRILEYFTDAFWKTVEQREKTNTKINDFVDHLRDMMKNKDIPYFVGNKVAAQAAQFFAAGFETTASAIAQTMYEFAVNPAIQDKARSEVIKIIKENGLNYDSVMKMKYLELCIQETLRKYPVLPFLDRKCLQDYKIPGTNLTIEKGTGIYISLFGLHHDEKYFPNPEKYDPERFLHNVNSEFNGLVYIPFGDGPRSCIGERFGMLGAKTALLYTLMNFELEKCSKTPIPIEFETKSFTLQSKVGLPIIFKKHTATLV